MQELLETAPWNWDVEQGDVLITDKHFNIVAVIDPKVCEGDAEESANLIAAAPDLYAALQELYDVYEELGASGDAVFWAAKDQYAGAIALAALAKARGE